MPRTPAEATRFTATGPHVHSKSTVASSTIDLAGPPPPNETPSQKVARLREAARKAKLGKESPWERFVSRSRLWADRAHKITASTLIIFSVVAGGVALLSFGDMALQNRRKKREWFAEQQRNYEKALETAKQAESDGTITEDLKLFLNKERAIEQVEAEKKARGTIWSRAKSKLYEGLAMEEKPTGQEIQNQISANLTESGKMIPVAVEKEQPPAVEPALAMPTQDSMVMESRGGKQSQLTPVGGPLDQLAEHNASAIRQSSSMWYDWLRRR